MTHAKGILSGLAAIFIAEFAFAWPFLRGSRATSLTALLTLLLGSLLSLKFWFVGLLLFGLFIVASRGNSALKVVFFWIPTVAASTVVMAFAAL